MTAIGTYFHRNGKIAQVVPGQIWNGRQVVVLIDGSSSTVSQLFKAASVLTLIIPIIMAIALLILCSTHQYVLLNPKEKFISKSQSIQKM